MTFENLSHSASAHYVPEMSRDTILQKYGRFQKPKRRLAKSSDGSLAIGLPLPTVDSTCGKTNDIRKVNYTELVLSVLSKRCKSRHQ
jgi:hypothetical protein